MFFSGSNSWFSLLLFSFSPWSLLSSAPPVLSTQFCCCYCTCDPHQTSHLAALVCFLLHAIINLWCQLHVEVACHCFDSPASSLSISLLVGVHRKETERRAWKQVPFWPTGHQQSATDHFYLTSEFCWQLVQARALHYLFKNRAYLL